MSLRDDISKEVIAALKAGEKLKLSTLRMLLSAIKYKEVDLKRPLTDEETQQMVSTLIRQRHDSVEQFRKGGRPELADKEEAEIEILKVYLPAQMSEDELRSVVKEAAGKAGATGPGDMGKLMKAVMPLVKGKADGKAISDMVKEVLGQ
ncbi:MAG: glutamyl-tRNA amidotransferase [Deltaproteobacteria bacterium RBG_19FT_COMBO_58_16]|nr:MAG: glutamyl-tRNA amidotransferase [Deltaproteobacteria bacterium RBG_19FT_COMBO_58_16]